MMAFPHIYDVNEVDFTNKVVERSAQCPVLVDFWAQWCGPCLVLGPVLEAVIEAEHGRIVLAKLEVDDNMRVAGHYRVRGFPTVIGFVDGQEIARFGSAKPKRWINEFIAEHFPIAS